MKKVKFECPKCHSKDVIEVSSTYGAVILKCEKCKYKANSVHFLVGEVKE